MKPLSHLLIRVFIRVFIPGLLIALTFAVMMTGNQPTSASAGVYNSQNSQGYPPPLETLLPLPSPFPTLPSPELTVIPISECQLRAIAYLAGEYSLPPDSLITGSYGSTDTGEWVSDGKEEWFDFPLTQKRACFVKVSVTDSDMVYGVALDEQGQVVDLEELRVLESQARIARCGKFETDLCERFAILTDEDRVTVAIWLTEIDKGAIYDAVATNYPPELQIGEGLPFDVGHPDYERALQDAEVLMADAYREIEQLILEFLEADGITAMYASSSAPVVFAELKKSTISTLAERSDVTIIDLLEGTGGSALDTTVPTDRIASFWNAGFTGGGKKVAVVEATSVNFLNPYLDHTNGGTCTASGTSSDDPSHATWVAGVVAMDGYLSPPAYRGVSPGATLISGGFGTYNGTANIITVSDCTVDTFNADVINLSFWHTDETIKRYFDHVAWNRRRTVVVASGNFNADNNYYVTIPGTGYNVITVGGFEDNGTSDWSNDAMYSGSKYLGPGSRDKPEVVAVTPLNTTNINGGIDLVFGTSFAAPQASGLAALIMQHIGVSRAPELIKAIIMAAAMHNIEGNSRLSDQDGVGGVDGALTYAITSRGRYGVASQGAYDYRTLVYSDFDSNGYYHYNVPFTRGERIRIVLAYNSHPDSTNPYNNDQLYSDLDLHVYRPSGGTQIAFSNSSVNNFEIVEFTADQTGTYDVRVRRFSWNASFEYIGIAWAKDATYLPDLRNTTDGWISEIQMQNLGAVARTVTVHYFNANGTSGTSTSCYLLPRMRCSISVNASGHIPYGTTGSAIVSGGEDVLVVVENRNANAVTNYTGITSAGQSGNPDWGQAATTLYAPTVKFDLGGRTTDLQIMNVGSASRTVRVKYYDDGGSYKGELTCPNLAVNARCVVTLPNANWGNLLNARIDTTASPNQPLAAVAVERDANQTQVSTYQLVASPSINLYAPLVKKDCCGSALQNTGLRIQNTSLSSAATVNVTYYAEGSSDTYTSGPYTINAGGTLLLYKDSVLPTNFLGSAKVSCSPEPCAQGTLAGQVSEAGTARKMTSNAFQDTNSKVAYVSHACNTCSFGGWTFVSGIRIQNLSSSTNSITIRYYNSAGSQVGNPEYITLGNYRSQNAVSIPAGLNGSAIITSDQPIAVVVNLANGDTNKDLAMTHNAPNR